MEATLTIRVHIGDSFKARDLNGNTVGEMTIKE